MATKRTQNKPAESKEDQPVQDITETLTPVQEQPEQPGEDQPVQDAPETLKNGQKRTDEVIIDDTEEQPDELEVYEEAKQVIKGMVDEVLEEKGIKGEAKEKTALRKKLAGKVFHNKPDCKKVYFTSDLIPFFESSDAKKHGNTLDDNTIVIINRE